MNNEIIETPEEILDLGVEMPDEEIIEETSDENGNS